MDRKYSILYVDDEEGNLHIFKDTFRREYNIYTAISAKKGLEILDNERIDLILTDQKMPEMDGVEFLKNALSKYPDLNRILVTAYTDFDAIRNAINEAQIFQYIQKPWTEEKLRNTIEKSLEVYQLKIENEKLTEQLKVNNELLEKTNRDLLDFEELKSEFISIISHEIRTPLNGLIGPFKMLKEELESNSGTRNVNLLLEMLDSSVEKLEQFSKLALQITLLKAKKYELSISNTNTNENIQNIVRNLVEEINKKEIHITYDINCNEIKADKELLNNCLNELIKNAIKYSDKGGIINVKSETIDEWDIIEVKDYGSGFDQRYLNDKYKLFTSDKKIEKRGLGLNLAVIKLIMDAHSGEIEVSNNENTSGASVKLFFKNTKSD